MEMNVGGRFRAPLASACLPRHCSPQLCRLYLFQSLISVLLESQRQEIKVRNRVSLDSQGQEIQVAYSSEVIKY